MEKILWENLSTELQNHYLTILWMDGHSENAIAKFFSTTKGRIVRRRNDLKLLSGGPRPNTKSEVNPERFRDLIDIARMDDLEDQGVIPITPPVSASDEELEVEPANEPEPEPEVELEIETEIEPVAEPEPESQPAQVLKPTPKQETCRWPIATATGARYCGKPVVPGHTVCEEHLRYVPPMR
jgi:hypothetical protein